MIFANENELISPELYHKNQLVIMITLKRARNIR